MNEAETRAEHIDPALAAAGWGVVEGSRILREYPITPGRIEGHGRRGKPLTADYVLVHRNRKLAVVEAKAWDKPLTEGVGQAKNYADKMAVRFTYATNGQGIYGIDMDDGRGGRAAVLSLARRALGLDLRRGERLARPLRRRALRGQGRLAPGAATTRTSPSSACMEAIADGEAAHPAHAGHRHRQDLHRLPGRLEALPQPLEPDPRAHAPPAHPLPRRPQHPRQPGLQRLLAPSPRTRWCASARRTSRRRARCRRTAASSSPSSRPS